MQRYLLKILVYPHPLAGIPSRRARILVERRMYLEEKIPTYRGRVHRIIACRIFEREVCMAEAEANIIAGEQRLLGLCPS